jgi:fluoroquinolone resistance protein
MYLSLTIAEEIVELGTGTFPFFLLGGLAGRMCEAEVFAKIRAVLFFHWFRDGLTAVPLRTRGIELAVEANLYVFSARKAAGGAVHPLSLRNLFAAKIAYSHGEHYTAFSRILQSFRSWRQTLDRGGALHYGRGMILFPHCTQEGCESFAVYGRNTCLLHTTDQHAYKDEGSLLLEGQRKAENMNLPGLKLSHSSLAEREFIGVRFSGMDAEKISFRDCKFRLCFFENSRFTSCDLKGTSMQYCVFAGSSLTDCDFSSTDILHGNFNGTLIAKCSFQNSDLYFSHFINAVMEDVSFVDCNLRKVNFANSSRTGVNFKYSNFEEAYFNPESVS